MARHDEILGECEVRVAVQVVVEQRGLCGSWVHIILELHAGVVEADVMKPAQHRLSLAVAPSTLLQA